jgi:quinol-cytochrome oxidoreductase complex cytochrome b subunit
VSAQNIKPTPGIQRTKNKAFILKKNKGIDMIIEVEKLFFLFCFSFCFIFSFIFCFSSSFIYHLKLLQYLCDIIFSSAYKIEASPVP